MKERSMADQTFIFETFLAPAWYKTYLYVTEYIERRVGVPTFLLNGETLEDFAAAYADGGFISPLSYIQLLSQHPRSVELIAASIPPGVSDQEALPSFFDIVVHKESAYRAMSDLESCNWAYHTGISHVEDRFMQEQGKAATNRRETTETSSQAQSLRLILEGAADATTIDSRMLNIVLQNSPRIAAQLRIIGTYSTSAGPLIVVATHVSPHLKHKVQQALLTMHEHAFFAQRLQEGNIERFIPASNTYYERYGRREAHVITDNAEAEMQLSAYSI